MANIKIVICGPYDAPATESPEIDDVSITETHYGPACDLGHIIAGHIRSTGQIPTPPAGDHYPDFTQLDLARELSLRAAEQGLSMREYAEKLVAEHLKKVNDAVPDVDDTEQAAEAATGKPSQPDQVA